jgi:hypothetical protein
MNSRDIKAALLQYYRYDKQYKLVALESYHFHNADVVCVNARAWIIETEVKVSIADMKADINKPKHRLLRDAYLGDHPDQVSLLHPMEWISKSGYDFTKDYKYRGHEFNFAVPTELEEDATTIRNTYYPYAGLILVRPEPYFYSLSMLGIRVATHPYHFQKPKADIKLITGLVKDQSATLTRLAVENSKLLKDRDLSNGK